MKKVLIIINTLLLSLSMFAQSVTIPLPPPPPHPPLPPRHLPHPPAPVVIERAHPPAPPRPHAKVKHHRHYKTSGVKVKVK